MRNLFLIFCFFVFLMLSCGSESDVATAPGKTDTTQTGTQDTTATDTTQYPVPDKLCALTFDDGPDAEKTPLVLDKLEYYDVVATFFVIGQKINNGTRSVLVREITMDCEIGNHSYGWQSMDKMDSAQIVESVRKTSDAIEQYIGLRPEFFRPPNLVTSSTMFRVIDLPFASGVTGCDWESCNNTPEGVAQNVLADMKDGAIILLHDVQESVPADSHPTPEALDILIPELKQRGYEFVTLSQLFGRKGVDPDVGNKMWRYVK